LFTASRETRDAEDIVAAETAFLRALGEPLKILFA
jgi:hypothetical protein